MVNVFGVEKFDVHFQEHLRYLLLACEGLGFRVESSGFGVESLGFVVWGLGFRVWGLGLRFYG